VRYDDVPRRGTGTPKLLAGSHDVFDPADATVVGNTGDDVELGGLLVCPDVDTVLFAGGDVLDRETWWGIEGDKSTTHDYLTELADAAGIEDGPRYLPDDRQTAGRNIANWRRFSGLRSSCSSVTATAPSTSSGRVCSTRATRSPKSRDDSLTPSTSTSTSCR